MTRNAQSTGRPTERAAIASRDGSQAGSACGQARHEPPRMRSNERDFSSIERATRAKGGQGILFGPSRVDFTAGAHPCHER
jgi:hypothetical protein